MRQQERSNMSEVCISIFKLESSMKLIARRIDNF